MLLDKGVSIFVEPGPGKVLSNFLKRIAGKNEYMALSVHDPASLELAIATINKGISSYE